MAITAANLTSGSATTGSSISTASISPSSNRLDLVTVMNTTGAGGNIPTVTGAGGTWTQVLAYLTSDNNRRITIFRDLSATPGSGVLTIDFAGQNQAVIIWSVDEFNGVDITGTHGSGAIVQSLGSFIASSTTTGATINLAALASTNNAAYGFIRTNAGITITSGASFTQLSVINGGGGAENAEWAINQTAVNWTWPSTTLNSSMVAVEISAGVVAGTAQTMAVVITPDPLRPDYRAALGSTTSPVRSLPVPVPPPSTGWEWGHATWGVGLWANVPSYLDPPHAIQEERPRARDYRVMLAASAQPINVMFRPPLPIQTAVPRLAWSDPKPPDYRVALASTTAPVRPLLFIKAVVDAFDAGPTSPRRKRGYWPALSSTTYPVNSYFLPVAAPVAIALPKSPWSEPRQPDYSRALESTTHSVGPFVGFIGNVTPSLWFDPPTYPMPLARDYRSALASTSTTLRTVFFPPAAVTPSRWFASPLDPLPIAKDYRQALASTSGFVGPKKLPPPPPPPPVPCFVTFQDGTGTGGVTLLPGAGGGPVTLAPASGATVTVVPASGTPGAVTLAPASSPGPVGLPPNPKCP